MNRTRIEWVKNPDGTQGYSWNPIRGLCPVDCKLPDGRSYCYARKIYKRFTPQWRGWSGTDEPFILADEFVQLDKLKKPTKIFVCSTYELFHSPDKFARDEIFKVIEKCSHHTFQILTKFPQNIDRPMPDNVWLGVTVTNDKDWWRAKKLQEKSIKAKIKFLSLEPLFERVRLRVVTHIDWIIIGKLTGYGNKHNPPKDWLVQYVGSCFFWNMPLFMKNNLKEIWKPDDLIQEFPK